MFKSHFPMFLQMDAKNLGKFAVFLNVVYIIYCIMELRDIRAQTIAPISAAIFLTSNRKYLILKL